MSRQPYSIEFADEIDDLKLSPHAFRLYMRIKRVFDETGQCCQRTTSELAEACNMSTGKVSDAKRELIEAGLLSISRLKIGNNYVDGITPLESSSPDAGRVFAKCYIYLAYSETGHHKIGMSTDPQRRIASFQLPVGISLVHSFLADNPREAESRLHALFTDKKTKGEWFVLSQKDVAHIQSIKEYFDGCFVV
jgi:hypothetical protein